MKTLLAIILGLIAGLIVIFLLESLGHKIYPLPANFDYRNIESFELLIKNAPMGALLLIILAWASGSLVGGLITSLLVSIHKRRSALIVGSILMLLGIINLTMISYPVWFWISGLAVYIPFAYFGFKISRLLKMKLT